MARRSLKDLQKAISQEGKKGSNNSGLWYLHWELPFEGETSVRILEDPDQDNEFIVYLPYMEHVLHIGDEQHKVPCIRNLGKNQNCPICNVCIKHYKNGDKDKGKYYYRNMYAILRGIVTKDGFEYGEGEESATGKVKNFKFSFQLYKKLETEIARFDPDEPVFWDLDDGTDFIIVKNRHLFNGREGGKYDLASGFARRATSIPDKWRDDLPDEPLSSLLPKIPSYEEADSILSKHIRSLLDQGDVEEEAEEETTTTSEEELMAKITRNRSSKEEKAKKESKVQVKSEPEDEDFDDDDLPWGNDDDTDADDILNQLKASK